MAWAGFGDAGNQAPHQNPPSPASHSPCASKAQILPASSHSILFSSISIRTYNQLLVTLLIRFSPQIRLSHIDPATSQTTSGLISAKAVDGLVDVSTHGPLAVSAPGESQRESYLPLVICCADIHSVHLSTGLSSKANPTRDYTPGSSYRVCLQAVSPRILRISKGNDKKQFLAQSSPFWSSLTAIMILGFIFWFWRSFEIITLIPTLGMLVRLESIPRQSSCID